MSYLQAFVIALLQGVTELFPVSSLGHSVLVPAWFGGSWQTMVTQSSEQNSDSSFYLSYVVALHCATALALMWFFRSDWVRIIRGFFRSLPRSLRDKRLAAHGTDERLAWMIVLGTIPVGIVGVALEHTFRTLFANPSAAAALLFVNGLILAGAELLRRSRIRGKAERPVAPVATAVPAVIAGRADRPAAAAVSGSAPDALARGHRSATATTSSRPPGARPHSHRKSSGGRARFDIDAALESDARLVRLSYLDGVIVGTCQIAALLAGISRSGITMAGGLWRGLNHEDAARFAFLLATPVILAAGVLKIPELFSPAAAHIHGQVVLGVVVTAISAYLSVRFLVRWFQTRTLTPFAIYCLVVGAASVVRFAF
ncbi:MAG TPA: undecaprenyl-diphosphate phosphatase [Streptosporangiaceae bacterium]|nr:undecaprenyl-diphosphate phosphatase [Streptosporangiaceae bacterium]